MPFFGCNWECVCVACWHKLSAPLVHVLHALWDIWKNEANIGYHFHQFLVHLHVFKLFCMPVRYYVRFDEKRAFSFMASHTFFGMLYHCHCLWQSFFRHQVFLSHEQPFHWQKYLHQASLQTICFSAQHHCLELSLQQQLLCWQCVCCPSQTTVTLSNSQWHQCSFPKGYWQESHFQPAMARFPKAVHMTLWQYALCFAANLNNTVPPLKSNTSCLEKFSGIQHVSTLPYFCMPSICTAQQSCFWKPNSKMVSLW